ncbi:hypothetical protein EV580_4764 [Mycobacterium sp. BK086]|uniref:hypothetical protein n=1 Tax=Mycobacterium sp. BK086 TaxID=2512165 RepID=UPI00105B6EE7|nr:hypothetical protein [Mycobacterium sp. BK086]TDO10475.1 hypothetical protein EV580_4764 [Mycobacterium sp. BK086]
MGPPYYAAPPSATQAGDVLGKLRSNKLILHLSAGALGGAVGALLAEVVPQEYSTSRLMTIWVTGLWSLLFTSVIATALFLSDAWHQRRELRPGRIGLTWLFGAAAGFVAGAVAQAVYLIPVDSFEFKNYVLRTFCWGIAGALIGGLLSRTVPNLGVGRGIAAGFVGGCIGGISFVLIAQQLPETWGRVVGIATLGLSLGLAMYVVEKLFREASLEVIWAPGETTQIGLGLQPITIGGNIEDDVFVRELPPNVSTIVLNNGQIEHFENYSGARTLLTNGSQLQVGPVYLVIHARQ